MKFSVAELGSNLPHPRRTHLEAKCGHSRQVPARGIMHTQVALKPLSPFAATLERQIQLEGTLHCPLEEAQRSLSGEGERRGGAVEGGRGRC